MLRINLIGLFPYIIVFNFITDYVYYLDEMNTLIPLFRILVNSIFIGAVLIDHIIIGSGIFIPIYLLLFYSFFLIFFSSDLTASIIEFLKFSSSLLFLPVSFLLINTKQKFRLFINSIYPILGLYVLFVVISNLYQTGATRYAGSDSDVFRVGLADAKLYMPAFLVGMLPFFIKNNIIKGKSIYFVLGFINFVLLTLTIRRTAIFIMVFIPLFNYLLAGFYKKIILYSLLLFVFGMLTYPLVEKQFNDRLAERKYLTEDDYSYEEEGRYLELGFVLKTFYESDSVLNYLFGKEAFNTTGNYGFYDSERPIHSDYTYIFFSSGLIGSVLYLLIFRGLFHKVFIMRSILYKCGLKANYQMYMTILVLIVLLGVSGNIWAVTYKTSIFSLLGAFLGVFFSKVNVPTDFKRPVLER